MCLDDARETVQRIHAGAQQAETASPVESRIIPGGTVVHISGMPFRLQQATVVSGHPANFAAAAVEAVFPQPNDGPDK